MQAVAIKELKNRLSAYLREVARGEVVLVTDRGKVVAELRQPVAGVLVSPSEPGLAHLHAQGSLVLGLPQSKRAYRRTKVRIRVATQALLDEERGEVGDSRNDARGCSADRGAFSRRAAAHTRRATSRQCPGVE